MNYKLLYQLELEDNSKLKAENDALKQQLELKQLQIEILKVKVDCVKVTTPIITNNYTIQLNHPTYFSIKA